MKQEIFVFGSNLSGIHGKGAALWAKRVHGAIQGVAHGIQGNAYAIPTRGKYRHGVFDKLDLDIIQIYVDGFGRFAAIHPEMNFTITPIGCGHAGFTPEQIAPLFKNIWNRHLPNVLFPPEFVAVLNKSS